MLYLNGHNGVFWGMLIASLLILILGTLVLRRFSEKTQKAALIILMVLTIIAFGAYKYALSIDTEYHAIRMAAGVGDGTFYWGEELPFQLCNINMILIPVALLLENQALLGFTSFFGPLGALMAVLMPVAGFEQGSLLLPRLAGFYGTHLTLLIASIGVMTLGLYKPRYRDIPGTMLCALLVSFVVFLINLFLRKTALAPFANYFFNMDPEGNAILELFHSRIPYPYLYQLGLFPIMMVYMGILTFITGLCSRAENEAHGR